MPFKLMLHLLCPVNGLDIRVIKMLTATDGISVGVCVLPLVFIYSVGFDGELIWQAGT